MFGGMTTAAQLMVKVGADVSEAQSKLAGMSSTFKNLGGQAMALGGKMTLGITGPLVAAGAVVTRFASDLEESTNKVNVVFGEQATAMQAWAESAAQAFGMSKQQALEAAGTFGNLFTAMGVAGEQSADMSQGLIQLAADLASFNNIDPTEALEKLRAGLVGEAEPLRTLGVQLSAAAVEARALEMGLAGTAKELTEADKVAARFALIMEQTATAQGDFARTSEGLANQMRTVKAQFADAGAQLGTLLLPYVTQLVGWISQLVTYVANLDPEMQKWLVAIAAVAAAIGPAVMIIGVLGTALGALLSPVGLVVAAIVGLAAIIVDHFGGIGPTVEAVRNAVESALAGLAAFMGTNGEEIKGFFEAAWGQISGIVSTAVQIIQAIVVPIFTGIANFLAEHGEAIKTVLSAAWQAVQIYIQTALTIIQGILSAALAILKGDWSGAWEIIKNTTQTVMDNMRTLFDTVMRALVTIGQVLLSELRQVFVDKFNEIKAFIQGIDLASVGAAMMQGLIGGIQSMAGALVDAARGVVQNAINAAKNLLGIRSPSRVFYGIGVDVITGLIQGIEDMTPEAVTTLSAALTAAMDGVLRVIEAASALGNMQVLADLPERMRALNTMIREMVAELKVLAEFYANPGSGLDSAKAVMDALAPVFAGVKNAVEAFVAMGGIAAIEMLGAGLQTFIRFLQEVVPQLVRALAKAAEGLSDDALLAALAMSEVLTGISDALRKAMDMLTQFAVFDVPFDLFERGMWKLKETVVNLVEWLIAVASGLKTDGLPAAQAFSQAAQAVSQALGAAMDMLAKFATFEVPFNLFERGMWKLKETVVNLVQWLVTVASGLNLEGVPAARLFAEMAGLITTLLGEAMTVLERVQRYVAPAEDAILDFLRDVQFLMERALRWVQLVIVPLVEDVGVDLFDVLTGMVESLGEALALLEGLADYVAVGETAILAFMDDLDDLVRVFVRWVLGSRSGPILLLEVPTELMAIFEDAMAALETAVGVLTALVDYVSPGEAAILAFMADLDDLVRAFVYWVMSSRSGPILLLDVPAELMVIFSAVMDGLAAAVDVLTSLVDYVSPGEEAIAAFTADYQRLFVAFVAWAEGAFTDVALETVTAVAGAVGSVFAGLGDAVDVLASLVDYVSPSEAAINAFTTDYQRLFAGFVAWAEGAFTDVALETVTAVAGAVGSVFAGLGDAAGVLSGIVDYVGPSSAAISSFETDYQRLFSNFATWAVTTFTDVAVELVQAVGDAVGSVFDGLGAAAATLQAITWYVGPTVNKIDRFMADMEQVMIRLRDWALGNLTTESTAFLLAFGQMAGTLFSAVGSALNVMEGIAGYTVSGSAFDQALQRFNDNLYTMLQSWRIWIVTVMDPETMALVAAFAGVMGAIVTGFRDALNLLMDIQNANLPTSDQLQAFVNAVTLLFNQVIQNFGNVASQIATLSGQMGSALATTLLIMTDHIALFAQQAAIEIDALFGGMGTQMWVQGRYVAEMFMNGLLAGMTNVNAQNLLLNAMNALALALKDVLMAAWGIASPSKVAEGIGKNFVAGLANGLADLQGIPGMIEDAVGLTMNNNVRLTPAPQRAYLTVNFQGAYQSGMSPEEEARISRVMVMELRRQGVTLVTR